MRPFRFEAQRAMRKAWRLAFAVTLVSTLAISCSLLQPSPDTSPSVRQQGVLNLWGIDPVTLDPAISAELTSHTYVMQVFSGLARLDASLQPAPDLAERWEISNGGETYTFYLRKGAKFHDGKEVTAHAFKYSWERACSPSTGSQTAATYLGDIVGATEFLQGKANQISGVEVIDASTLRVTIDAPKAYFLSKLTYPTAFVVDQTNVQSGAEWWHKPNGTGPFRLKEWRQGEVLALEPNELYYQQAPKTRQVVFRLLAGMPMAMYEMGQVDVAPVFEDYIDRVTDRSGPFFKELDIFPELSLFYIGFNTHKPPFDDVNIRKAFCYAINKERIIDLTLKDTVTKAVGILPPGMPGYNERLSGLDLDIAQARSLIASSRYVSAANLPPIVLTTSGWGGNIPTHLGAIIQDWQENLGVEVQVRQLEPEVFSYSLKDEADGLFFSGWIADYPDPQDFLDVLFHTGAEYNTGHYSNPNLDKLLDGAAVEQDEARRLRLYQEAEQILLDEAACLPLWFGTNYVLIKPYVSGYHLNALGIPALADVSVRE